MDIEEYENFKNKHLQHPITFLTEENLDKLEDHCRKAIHYERGVEHQVVLELLERYKEFLTEREEDKKKIEELEDENRVQKHQIMQVFDRGYIHKDKIREIINNRKERLLKGKKTYTNKIRINELNMISKLLEDK
ncbi:MAG: hypothetical protein BHV96_05440 [Clostridium sp. CAG:354_28_25]|jgi:uncharacterized protein YktA (UPF0223 family)|nr:MAG: hypothetical protein BHV96_05440 [Clostridium sp. CAG:354_28_25]